MKASRPVFQDEQFFKIEIAYASNSVNSQVILNAHTVKRDRRSKRRCQNFICVISTAGLSLDSSLFLGYEINLSKVIRARTTGSTLRRIF